MRAPGSRASARDGLLALASVASLGLGELGCAWVNDWVESIRWQPLASRPSSAASSRPSSPDGDGQGYVVRYGDTLWSIAGRHGVDVDTLARVNHLQNANRIAAGERLWIPASGAPSVALAPPKPATPVRVAPAPPSTAKLDASLDHADALLRAARFQDALTELERARGRVAALEAAGSPAASAKRARLEVMAGTAWVALGADVAAEESFERALRADAGLTLDPAQTSPKVMRSFEQSRRRLEADPRRPRVADLDSEP